MDNRKNNSDFENLKLPDVKMPEFQKQLKLTMLNAKTTAIWGSVLIILPSYFVFASIMKANFGMGFLYAPFSYFFMKQEQLGIGRHDISPIIFIGSAFVAVALNLLSIIHFSVSKDETEFSLNISLKKKFWNIALVIISGLLFSVFILYGIVENL